MPQKTYDTYIQRVHRQHNSLVVVVPYLLAQRQKIKAGSYLVFVGDENSKFIKVMKFEEKGAAYGRRKRDSSRKNQRGRPRVKARL